LAELKLKSRNFGRDYLWSWGLHMRANNLVDLVYPESALPKASADVYDFGARQTESSRFRRIKALEQENASLTRMVSQIGIEIARLRKLLAGPS
jgi:hypothetical protein